QSFIVNLMFSFTLIETLRTGVPLPISREGVNGVMFIDASSAWNSDADPVFFFNKGAFHTESMRMAFGFGARINLGYFVLRYDWGREHRFERGLGKPRGFFTFGPEF